MCDAQDLVRQFHLCNMIITEKDLQMLHTMPPPPPGEPLLHEREDDLKLGEFFFVYINQGAAFPTFFTH